MKSYQVAAIFTDYMVLQQQKNIKIWGIGMDGLQLEVTLAEHVSTVRVQNGRWMAILPAMKAGGPYTLQIHEQGASFLQDPVEFQHVMIGEVWLAGGQSNMEYELQNAVGGKELLSAMPSDDSLVHNNYNQIRYYQAPKIAYRDADYEQKLRSSKWQLCTSKNAASWSAVAYLYATHLAEELQVTIGIIGCNWGGTSASAWMDSETLRSDLDTQSYLDDYFEAMKGKTLEDHIREREEYMDYAKVWDSKKEECYLVNPEIDWNEILELCGECRWPGPMGPYCEFRPSGLYETMLKPLAPFALRGFIYYQGESDDHKASIYYKLLRNMIGVWRREFEEDTLPFLFVQLPMFKNKLDPDRDSWAHIREAQMKVFNTVKNTGIAVILDCGTLGDIHPKDKREVAKRLALQAFYHVYGLPIVEQEAFGPVFRDALPVSNGLLLHFKHAQDGLILKDELIRKDILILKNTVVDSSPINSSAMIDTGFEIADEYGHYYPASVVLSSDAQGEPFIILSSKDVPTPVKARYCFTNYREVTVFGKNGIPLAPFRTVID